MRKMGHDHARGHVDHHDVNKRFDEHEPHADTDTHAQADTDRGLNDDNHDELDLDDDNHDDEFDASATNDDENDVLVPFAGTDAHIIDADVGTEPRAGGYHDSNLGGADPDRDNGDGRADADGDHHGRPRGDYIVGAGHLAHTRTHVDRTDAYDLRDG